MAYSMNNATTADTLEGTSAKLQTPVECVRWDFTVSNASVMREYQSAPMSGSPSAGSWSGLEVFYPPGFYSLERLTQGIRFRSADPGAPAQVTCEAMTARELP